MQDVDLGLLMEAVPWSFRPLHPVWIAWAVLALVALPRRADVWGVTALALGLRLGLASPAAALPHGKGWWMAMLALGTNGVPAWGTHAYGDAWDAAGTLWSLPMGGSPDTARWLSLLASTLTVPWLMEAVRAGGGGRVASRVAGVAMATLPVAVWTSQTVDRFVLVPMLATVAWAGWCRQVPEGADRAPSWGLGLVSAALLAHTRPLAVPAAVGLMAALWWRRPVGARAPWLGLGLGATAVALWRISELGAMALRGVPGSAKLSDLAYPWQSLGDLAAATVALRPDMVPAAIPALAVLGALRPSGLRDRAGWLVLWGALTLPWLHFGFDFDLLRMQGGGLPVLVGLASVGATSLWVRTGRRRVVAVGLLALAAGTWWQARAPRGDPTWSWIVEERVFRAGLPACDRSLPVVIGPERAAWDLGQWLRLGGWKPRRLGAEVPPGACRFVGLDAWMDDRDRPPSTQGWRPVGVQPIVVSSDGWYEREGEQVVVGWYRKE